MTDILNEAMHNATYSYCIVKINFVIGASSYGKVSELDFTTILFLSTFWFGFEFDNDMLDM